MTVTFDTNVFPAGERHARAVRLGIDVVTVTVARREAEGSSFEDEIRTLSTVLETGVLGESRWGECVWGSRSDGNLLERLLDLLSNHSFPAPGHREHLSSGQRRQLRDAMILCAHLHKKRDILVSNDKRAFINDGRREAIENEFDTRIMTVEEFDAFLDERERCSTV